MPQSFTPNPPTDAAGVASRLAPTLPLGSETRVVSGLYGAAQKALDMMAIAGAFVAGGTIGDAVARTLVTLRNRVGFQSDVEVGGNLTVDGATTLVGNVSTTADVSVGGAAVITGNAIAAADLGVGADLAVTGTTSLTGLLAAAAGAIFSGRLLFAGIGRARRVPVIGNSTTNETADVSVASAYIWPAVGTSHNCAVDSTHALDGDEMDFSITLAASGTNTLTLTGLAVPTSQALRANTSGSAIGAKLQYSTALGGWIVISRTVQA